MRRRNDPYPFPTVLPFTPGREVAGTVAALGDGVDGPPVGTPVFALVGNDGPLRARWVRLIPSDAANSRVRTVTAAANSRVEYVHVE